jgi:hypothetical protein
MPPLPPAPQSQLQRLRGLTFAAVTISVAAAIVIAVALDEAVGAAIAALAIILGVAAAIDGPRRVDEPGASLSQVLPVEIERARRHERPLSLLSAVPTAGLSVDDVRERIRLLDRAWLDADRLVMLLVETDHAGAAGLASRLSVDGLVTSTSIASFPEDALTSGALVARLSEPDVVRLPSPVVLEPVPAPSYSGGEDARTG